MTREQPVDIPTVGGATDRVHLDRQPRDGELTDEGAAGRPEPGRHRRHPGAERASAQWAPELLPPATTARCACARKASASSATSRPVDGSGTGGCTGGS